MYRNGGFDGTKEVTARAIVSIIERESRPASISDGDEMRLPVEQRDRQAVLGLCRSNYESQREIRSVTCPTWRRCPGQHPRPSVSRNLPPFAKAEGDIARSTFNAIPLQSSLFSLHSALHRLLPFTPSPSPSLTNRHVRANPPHHRRFCVSCLRGCHRASRSSRARVSSKLFCRMARS